MLEIAEVDGMEGSEVKTHSLFRWRDDAQVLERTGRLERRLKLERRGIELPGDG